MPLLKPKPGEEQNTFVSRCVSDKNMNREFTDNNQLLAVCYSLYKRSKEKTDEEFDDEVDKLTKIEKSLDMVPQIEDLQEKKKCQ